MASEIKRDGVMTAIYTDETLIGDELTALQIASDAVTLLNLYILYESFSFIVTYWRNINLDDFLSFCKAFSAFSPMFY